jgi:hypothetical protein
MSTPTPERWGVGNEHNQVIGGDLVSGTTIVPTHRIHYVTGTGAIVNIALPWPNFSGDLVLIPQGAFTTTIAGNVATALTAVADRPIILFYVPSKGKWFGHAIA